MKRFIYAKIIIAILVIVLACAGIYLVVDYNSTNESLVESYDDMMSNKTASESKGRFYIQFQKEQEEAALLEVTDGNGNSELNLELSGDSWYTDIRDVTASTSYTEFGGGYRLYDGLPWDAESNTYFYNQKKAKDDIYELFAQAGVERSASSGQIVNSSADSSTYSQTLPKNSDNSLYDEVDGMMCLPIGVTPAMVTRNYFEEKSREVSSTFTYSDLGTLKLAVVVTEKGNDVNDQSKWKYVPATNLDSKAHTWFGGVVQTNVKVISPTQIQVSRNWSGTAASMQHNVTLQEGYDIVETIRKVNNEIIPSVRTVNFHMGTWGNNELESYGLSSNTINFMKQFEVVGIVVWGGFQ